MDWNFTKFFKHICIKNFREIEISTGLKINSCCNFTKFLNYYLLKFFREIGTFWLMFLKINFLLFIGIVMFCFICTFSSWITVYKCYYQFKEGSGYDQHSAGGYGNSSDGQLTQPLLSGSAMPGPAPPPLPPNHPSAGTSYQLGQYPQYYPPHGNRALPSAPPNIYPSLANA